MTNTYTNKLILESGHHRIVDDDGEYIHIVSPGGWRHIGKDYELIINCDAVDIDLHTDRVVINVDQMPENASCKIIASTPQALKSLFHSTRANRNYIEGQSKETLGEYAHHFLEVGGHLIFTHLINSGFTIDVSSKEGEGY